MKLSLDIKNTTLMETHYVVHGVDTIDVETALELLSAEELEMLAEGAKRKIVIRGGKKKIIFKCPTGQKLGKRGGRICVKVGGAEKALRSRRAVKAARKSKGKRGRANSKRRRSMTKRSNFI